MPTLRIIVFGIAIALAASPLIWFEMDPKAGEKLLQWTSKSPPRSVQAR